MKLSSRFASAVLIRGSAIGCSLLVAMMLARTLGAEDFGRYVFVQSIIIIASIMFEAGLPHLVVREVASNDHVGNKSLVKGVLVRSFQFCVPFSALLIVGWLAVEQLVPGLASSVEPGADLEAQLVTIALLSLPFIGLLGVYGGALRAFDQYLVGQVLNMVFVRAVNLLLLGLVLAFPVFGELDAVTAMVVFTTSYFTAAASAAVLLWRQPEYDWRGLNAEYKTRDWLFSLLPLTLIGGLQIIVTKTDVVMLRFFAGPTEVGIYHIASQLGNLTLIAKAGVMLVVGPRFARHYREGDNAGLQKELTSAARFVFLAGLPVVVGLVAVGRPLIGWFFGEEFVSAYSAMVILSLGYLTLALFGSIDTLLKMTNNEHVLLHSIAIAIVLNIALNALLIPEYGPMGAAIATATSMISWRLVLVYRARRLLNLVSFAFYRKA